MGLKKSLVLGERSSTWLGRVIARMGRKKGSLIRLYVLDKPRPSFASMAGWLTGQEHDGEKKHFFIPTKIAAGD